MPEVNTESQRMSNQLIGCYLGIATCYLLKGNFRKSLKFNEMALTIGQQLFVSFPKKRRIQK
ncbi:hypothetical protein D4L85_16465 [Chryseolinea soli]|uniref:Tetratricopeptide repeat protein n=1 Tax=Chryseolinea soli TaxID=2321403 RepID=A0A385SQ26_9BACT|nr:hypothetical protein D4L85_16465 [Chryseolinea soli]